MPAPESYARSLGNALWQRRDYILLFVLAFALRFAMHRFSVEQIGAEKLLATSPDTINYVAAGKALAQGSGDYEVAFWAFGPGYASFLAANFVLFGVRATPAVIIQILLSSLACLLVYKFAQKLLRSRAIAVVAGLLAALSYTAISLSCLLLSDTLFFFLFALSLVLYLKGLTERCWWPFILSGLLVGCGILTRPIGQFWPAAMVVIAIFSRRLVGDVHRESPRNSRLTTIVQPVIAVGIALLIALTWAFRNNAVHGVPAVAISSAGGPINIAAETAAKPQGLTREEQLTLWIKAFLEETNQKEFTPADSYRLFRSKSLEIFRNRPIDMIRTLLHWSWINVNDICHLHRLLIPKSNPKTIPLEKTILKSGLNFLNLSLCIVGMVLLLATRRFGALLVLGSVYCYFFLTVGGTRWQGSRLFLPGQLAAVVLIALTLVSTAKAAFHGLVLVFRRLRYNAS
ncbi:MAG TPA: glycosyltransferase family 39 protein [Candidatus Deferrimicrobium sp.]|nr:glycosyltransferase family 39 protein [Candidatus Deferrimicrobium sp.]